MPVSTDPSALHAVGTSTGHRTAGPPDTPDALSANRPVVVRPGSMAAWSAAARTRSLPVAVSPVLVGAAFGLARTGSLDLRTVVLVLVAALLMQVITNLQNDVGYTARGAERRGGRTGLPRATAQGWLSELDVRLGIVATSTLAATVGVVLTAWHGWPVLAIGAASLLAALAYMGGPRPIAYTPHGELTVFVFFGLVAVLGTDWVLTGSIGVATGLASVALGSLAASALAVNNHRDIAHDARVGRRTWAVVHGEAASRRRIVRLWVLPFALLPAIAWAGGSVALMLPMLLAPAAWQLRHDLAGARGPALNGLLFRTFRLELAYAVALACAALFGQAVR